MVRRLSPLGGRRLLGGLAVGLLGAWALPLAGLGLASVVNTLHMWREMSGDPEYWHLRPLVPAGVEINLSMISLLATAALLQPALVLALVYLLEGGQRRPFSALAVLVVQVGGLVAELWANNLDLAEPGTGLTVRQLEGPLMQFAIPLMMLAATAGLLIAQPTWRRPPALSGPVAASAT